LISKFHEGIRRLAVLVATRNHRVRGDAGIGRLATNKTPAVSGEFEWVDTLKGVDPWKRNRVPQS